ncbi:MAG TPA: WYL domain-containing protein [Hanamia sp.]|nr:WYL domain-containing protein [Hanamia sp.]
MRPNVQPETIVQTDSIACIQGEEYIEDLVYAISNRREIRLAYQAYHQDKAFDRKLFPLLLKEYRNRWYLLAYKFAEKKIKTYGLDRVKRLKVSDNTVHEEIDFDPLYYFKHSFGITTPDVPVKKVVLRFSKAEAPYVRSLPIHPTQEIIEETDEFLTVAITVTLSYELYEYILSKSPDIKVLEPAEVISEIAKRASETKKNYE